MACVTSFDTFDICLSQVQHGPTPFLQIFKALCWPRLKQWNLNRIWIYKSASASMGQVDDLASEARSSTWPFLNLKCHLISITLIARIFSVGRTKQWQWAWNVFAPLERLRKLLDLWNITAQPQYSKRTVCLSQAFRGVTVNAVVLTQKIFCLWKDSLLARRVQHSHSTLRSHRRADAIPGRSAQMQRTIRHRG